MWWITEQYRLRTEREAISTLNADWFKEPKWHVDNQLRLNLTFKIAITRGCFALRLTYHNTFPASPPSILPIDENLRLSGHQYGSGGELCLEIRNDNWTPDVTGAQMIKSARKLLEDETPGDDGITVHAPSAHGVQETITLRSELSRFYIEPMARLSLWQSTKDGVPIEIGIEHRSGKGFVAHLLSIGEGSEDKITLSAPDAMRKLCAVQKGNVFLTNASTTELSRIKNITDLQKLLAGRLILKFDQDWCVLIKNKDNSIQLISHLPNDDELICFKSVLAPFEGNRSGLTNDEIKQRKIGIVGLGSLGSKIAISLGRAGIRNFELVDADILHLGNLERHQGDWRDLGRHKVEITESHLYMIDRDIKTGVWRSAIGAQVSSQEAANVTQALTSCDLIIDATANHDVFNYLADISLRHKLTLVWGSIYAGGLGGEIARFRAGRDPSPYDIRTVINQYYESSNESPPTATGYGYDGSIQEQEPIQASDADVSLVAAHIVNLTLDALLGTEPSHFDAHAYLIGFKRGWLFSGPFDTHPIVVDAPIVNSAQNSVDNAIEAEFIQSLFNDIDNETADSTRDN